MLGSTTSNSGRKPASENLMDAGFRFEIGVSLPNIWLDMHRIYLHKSTKKHAGAYIPTRDSGLTHKLEIQA